MEALVASIGASSSQSPSCHDKKSARYVPAAMQPSRNRASPLPRLAAARRDDQAATAARITSEQGSAAPAKEFRGILASPGLHLGPACHDALSAKLVQNAGFKFTFMSGFGVSASRLACPDTGLISYGEMVDQGRNITAAVSIPVIGDGDAGYGNAMNVKRTVKGYIQAGFAGILLEDQILPKACGHTTGREVVSRQEAIARVKAAVDAREESGEDLVIVARSDARQAVSLEEALWRAEAFADAGADVLFIDALMSKEEMRKFCGRVPAVPKLANMLEGGGKTPLLAPIEIEEIGYKIVAYPLSLLGVSIRAMQDALVALKSGRFPSKVPAFDEVKDVVGFNRYYDEEKRYFGISKSRRTSETANNFSTKEETPFHDKQSSTVQVITPEVLEEDSDSDWAKKSSNLLGIWSRVLRVKITGSSGIVKLDVRIPAGFLDGLAKTIPGVAGINFKEILDNASSPTSGQQLLDIEDKQGDRIQIFFE
ncbi:uncharacterized protein LOC9660850 [Selaginella moellendorffii]|uniref:uncharacterized protein LOC9660850 n=1 Tax=Selaginella moellendorffii TaxID=88036 RepID=UPI000D1C2ABF|nr:uncharacterized protein LOC9660850 [Selaginella moellendorffii]|eukprot:XP_024543214.1 uncharacterized protein LOC9660850 [Selaginella moellendorffii]